MQFIVNNMNIQHSHFVQFSTSRPDPFERSSLNEHKRSFSIRNIVKFKHFKLTFQSSELFRNFPSHIPFVRKPNEDNRRDEEVFHAFNCFFFNVVCCSQILCFRNKNFNFDQCLGTHPLNDRTKQFQSEICNQRKNELSTSQVFELNRIVLALRMSFLECLSLFRRHSFDK